MWNDEWRHWRYLYFRKCVCGSGLGQLTLHEKRWGRRQLISSKVQGPSFMWHIVRNLSTVFLVAAVSTCFSFPWARFTRCSSVHYWPRLQTVLAAVFFSHLLVTQHQKHSPDITYVELCAACAGALLYWGTMGSCYRTLDEQCVWHHYAFIT
jgi:hypothetical protein